MEHLYIAFITSISFFIMKQLLNRKSLDKDFNKQLLRDCVLLFAIVYITSYGIEYYTTYDKEVKTEIFTGLPGF
jgi:uncharacterized membrane protein YjjP (DUF1212 family)